MKVLIIEDDSIAVDMAETLLRQHGYQSIDQCSTVKGAEANIKKNFYDIIFLDIHLADGKGTDVVEWIPAETNIIFTTIDPTYAVDAFKLNAVDYLLKPITEDRFVEALKKIEGENGQRTIFIKADLQYHKVLVDSILYAKSTKDYLTVHTQERSYTFFARMKNFIKKLPAADFMQCHRSYLINLKWVESFSTNEVIVNGVEIPVSNSHKKELAERMVETNQNL